MKKPESAKLFVIAAPSGAGKTTLVRELMVLRPDLRFSISYTTRERRATEEHGRDYFFVSEAEFLRLDKDGELLESAQVFDNHYGTGRSQVLAHLEGGHSVILEIDWQGARQVKSSMPDAVSVFVLPPSADELERRLRDRKTDSDEVIARRLRDASGDMAHWTEFSFAIINDDLEQAVRELEAIVDGDSVKNRVGNEALQAAVRRILAS